MALGHHTDTWYENQNRALGLPPGTRHSDAWYQQQMQQRQQAAQAEQWRLEGLAKEQQNQAYNQQQAAPPPPPPTAPTGPTAAELATAEADRQAKMRARRDEWDRLNNQGAYDPDGWQSIGYQPDPVAMPSWWLDGLELGTTAPAVPLPLPPGQAATQNSMLSSLQTSYNKPNLALLPGVTLPTGTAPTGVVVPGETAPAPGGHGSQLIQGMQRGSGAPPTNPLAQLFGPVGSQQPPQNALSQATGGQVQPQPWTQKPAAQAQPAGVWGQNPFAAQQPDAGAWGQQPAASGQPSTQSAFGAPNQTQGLQSWTQPRRQRRQPGVWGQQTQAGTWGAGSL